jgi:hypothetical protein
MSHNNLNLEPTISDGSSSPTSVSWFIDRTGDSSITHNEIYFNNYLINAMQRSMINNRNRSIVIQNSLNEINQQVERNTDISGNIMFNDLELNKNIEINVNEDLEITEEQRECCVCMETKDKPDICLINNCAHTFCVDCCSKTMITKNKRQEIMTCPLCRADVVSISVKNIESKDKFIKTNQ